MSALRAPHGMLRDREVVGKVPDLHLELGVPVHDQIQATGFVNKACWNTARPFGLLSGAVWGYICSGE